MRPGRAKQRKRDGGSECLCPSTTNIKWVVDSIDRKRERKQRGGNPPPPPHKEKQENNQQQRQLVGIRRRFVVHVANLLPFPFLWWSFSQHKNRTPARVHEKGVGGCGLGDCSRVWSLLVPGVDFGVPLLGALTSQSLAIHRSILFTWLCSLLALHGIPGIPTPTHPHPPTHPG